MFSNDNATLTFYKESLKGLIQDYVLRFNHNHCEIEKTIPLAFDIVKQLIDEFHQKDKTIKARLVALVCYKRIDKDEDEVNVYHPSYQSEIVDDVEEFFTNHMLRIAQRIEDFNRHGSNLIIQCIAEIHLHLTVIN